MSKTRSDDKRTKEEKEENKHQKEEKKKDSKADWSNRALLSKAFVQEIPRKRNQDPVQDTCC